MQNVFQILLYIILVAFSILAIVCPFVIAMDWIFKIALVGLGVLNLIGVAINIKTVYQLIKIEKEAQNV